MFNNFCNWLGVVRCHSNSATSEVSPGSVLEAPVCGSTITKPKRGLLAMRLVPEAEAIQYTLINRPDTTRTLSPLFVPIRNGPTDQNFVD